MNIHYEEGDALKGDLIVAEARKTSKPKLVIGSSRHRAQQIILEENAFTLIRKKLRFLPKT
ncbi:MAG TPA: hypothetical protein VJH23_03760 [archaeon]|nr:hypothetical protein [archaeon]